MNFRRHRKENLDLNITPMIDVVFLLLIFFMVTTTFKRDTELKIKLPEAQGQQQTVDKVLEITIDATGNYYVEGHQVVNRRLETLKKAILQAIKDEKRLPVVINADAKSPHQAVISVLDAAQQLGFIQITFATTTPVDSTAVERKN